MIISVLGKARKAGERKVEVMALKGKGRITSRRVIIKKENSVVNRKEYFIFDKENSDYSEEE